jgi:hypothetical protein
VLMARQEAQKVILEEVMLEKTTKGEIIIG